jgi:hypothetical protein
MFSPVDRTGRETPGHRARLAKPRSLARSGPRHAPVRLVATSVNNRGAPPSVNTTGRDSETQAERDEATGPVSTGVQGPSAKVEPRGLDRFQRALPDQSLGRFQRVSRDLRAERDKSTGPVPTGVQGAFSEGGAAWSGPVPTGCSRPILGPVSTGIQGSPSGARQIHWAGSNRYPGSLGKSTGPGPTGIQGAFGEGGSRVVWTGSNGLFQTNPWAGSNGYPRISKRSETNPLGRVQPVSREPPAKVEPRGLDRFQRAVPDQSLGRFQRVSRDLQAERDKTRSGWVGQKKKLLRARRTGKGVEERLFSLCPRWENGERACPLGIRAAGLPTIHSVTGCACNPTYCLKAFCFEMLLFRNGCFHRWTAPGEKLRGIERGWPSHARWRGRDRDTRQSGSWQPR